MAAFGAIGGGGGVCNFAAAVASFFFSYVRCFYARCQAPAAIASGCVGGESTSRGSEAVDALSASARALFAYVVVAIEAKTTASRSTTPKISKHAHSRALARARALKRRRASAVFFLFFMSLPSFFVVCCRGERCKRSTSEDARAVFCFVLRRPSCKRLMRVAQQRRQKIAMWRATRRLKNDEKRRVQTRAIVGASDGRRCIGIDRRRRRRWRARAFWYLR